MQDPIRIGEPPDRTIDRMYAYLAVGPDGKEGVMASTNVVMLGGIPVLMPLVTSSKTTAIKQYPLAVEAAGGRDFKLYEFSVKKDVTEEIKLKRDSN